MAKAVADATEDGQGGFATDGKEIIGFSHMHDSGTGGSNGLGNFPIFPQSGCPDGDLNNCKFTRTDRASQWVDDSVEATPGYFSITLNTSIRAEMTVSNHSALYRFTFPDQDTTDPQTPLNPLILVDLNDLNTACKHATASVDPQTGRISGTGTFGPSFGLGSYDLHFCVDFAGAPVRDTGIWNSNFAENDLKNLYVKPMPGLTSGGAWTQFEAPTRNNQILVRVGVSALSVDRACGNAENEIPDFNFRKTRRVAREAWRQKLDVVKVDATGVSEELQKVFWSGIYRTMISPQDYTGENPLWHSTEPYYDSFYCIWDSFRSQHPLLTIVDPESQARMVRALIDIYRHEGKLPDCRMSFCKGYTQGGSNADIVLVDFYLKFANTTLGAAIDWDMAYEAVVSDAEDEPYDWNVEGRGGLTSWKTVGYIPFDDHTYNDKHSSGPFTRSISRTVEYAYDDYCISRLATYLDRPDDATKYLSRSFNWKNLYNPNQQSFIDGTVTPFTGFLQPRLLNTTFAYQDPLYCSPLLNPDSCYFGTGGHETYEGSSFLYTFFAPHDHESLIATLGGPESFTARLEYLHSTPNLLNMGDEQAFLTVFQFHYSARPGLSSKYAHSYIPSLFNASYNGIPGNDDSGAMGAFAVLAMLGLYPVAGQDVYLITPPFFPSISITNPVTGNTATIKCVNFDAGYDRIFVKEARLDRVSYKRNWIGHEFFLKGGVLELVLAEREGEWGTGEGDLPPSVLRGGEES
ncbi:MAG: hypothetical protein M1834_007678 [Cirrosporium novae-zelandiae]|nr:MAG: hypothetical protein M1834_007678 [Cirrosporium novae-zelandiae]